MCFICMTIVLHSCQATNLNQNVYERRYLSRESSRLHMQSAVVNAAFGIDMVMCKEVSFLTSFLAPLAAFYNATFAVIGVMTAVQQVFPNQSD